MRSRMAMGMSTSRSSVGGMTQRSSVSTESSGDEDSEDENIDWRKCAIKLEEENEMLRRQLLAKDVKVAALKAEVEGIRVDVIARSQKIVECDPVVYKRITEWTKKKLFRHIKFITSDTMMNNLEEKDSLANLTMNEFKIDVRDRIAWWRAYGYVVSDTISNQRSQVNQAVKAQILSK
jgi:hypothetical protein